MRRCRHKRSRESISLIPQPNGHARSVETRWCFDCESRIGLGPSSDESEAVRAEILAAFLVNPGGFVSVMHKDDHNLEWSDRWFGFAFREDCIGCQAEHLAHAIATHEAEETRLALAKEQG